MAAPKTQIVQMKYNNPGATAPLVLPVIVVCNTSDDDLRAHVRENATKVTDWAALETPHNGIAVMIGGGASINGQVEEIKRLQRFGGTTFAMNAASAWAHEKRIPVDYQVIADAKQETAELVDPQAWEHLFASQCHPDTIRRAGKNLRLWHLEFEGIEDEFPPERRKHGGYVLVGGGAAVGNAALCLAYTMGFREFHIFGYDSCHTGGESHAYPQPMNWKIPCVDVEWAGKQFTASVAMKAQAEKFQITGQILEASGCTLNLYGDGLLQTMWQTRGKDVGEREKYVRMWQINDYRNYSPGEESAARALEVLKPAPGAMIIDFGCGTGRASIRFAEAGYAPLLIDFADNCRDEEALGLPFLEWDLTQPCPASARYGYCSDVMEHIPPEDVDTVINNIMASANRVAFRISTVEDSFGGILGLPLHLTVKPPAWWKDKFKALGYKVLSHAAGKSHCLTCVER